MATYPPRDRPATTARPSCASRSISDATASAAPSTVNDSATAVPWLAGGGGPHSDPPPTGGRVPRQVRDETVQLVAQVGDLGGPAGAREAGAVEEDDRRATISHARA